MSSKVSDDKIRSMADLLRSGATLTNLSCPACSSPLFRLKSGDLWCAHCQKKVIVVREGEETREVEFLSTLSRAESTLLMKIWEINERLRIEDNPEEIHKLSALMLSLLDNLEKIRKIEKLRR